MREVGPAGITAGHFRRIRIKYSPADNPDAEVQRTITGFGLTPKDCKTSDGSTVLSFWESMFTPANPFLKKFLERPAVTELIL